MKLRAAHLVNNKNLQLVTHEGKQLTIAEDHISYKEIMDAFKKKDYDTVAKLADPARVVSEYSEGRITIENGRVYYLEDVNNKDSRRVIHNSLTQRIVKMLRQGQNVDSMVKFLERLQANPSYRAVQELYTFLERNELPITLDGKFLAYKKVKGDYTSIHDGKTDNSVGNIVEMPRNAVDDNANNTCSTGLHFCSQAYLPHFGGDWRHKDAEGNPAYRVVILEIDPADVVSIPSDYNGAKGRACRYEVVGELGTEEFQDPTQVEIDAVRVTKKA